MKRRQFLGTSLATGVAAVVGEPSSKPASLPRSSSPAPVQAFELEEITVAALQDGYASGKWTARQVTEMYLARIESVDRRGPRLSAVIEVNPDAVALAEAMDKERGAGKSRGPLHGVPILIKDNIDTGDRMQTTAGSLALEGSIAPRDATIAAKLREAGAVIIGKTNLSEWANFRGSNSSSGWSGRGGQTRNPYVLDRSPCGSSSGSGSAGAANLATITIGTETDGSILCPSSINGLVGIKPTVGLWSRAGIIPISSSQDTAGPMCRTVADAATLLGPLTGVDPRDSATAASSGRFVADYRRFLDAGALKGARLGVVRKHVDVSAKTEAVFTEALAALQKAGAILVDPVDFADPGPLGAAERQVMIHEYKVGIDAYLASLGPKAAHRSLADLIAFNKAHADRELRYYGQESMEAALKTAGLSAPKYRAALATCRRLARTQGIDARLATHRLDALIAPTTGPSWPIDLVNGDRFTGGSTTWSAVAGYPAITVPMGTIHDLPVGLTFMGKAWSEGRMISLAYGFEQATKARTIPRFRDSI